MLLSEIIDQLTYGELSLLSVTDHGTKITSEEYPKLAAHINMALLKLFARFPIRHKEIIVDLDTSVKVYNFKDIYLASSGSGEPIKYLNDSDADITFSESDFLKLEEVAKIAAVATDPDTPLPVNVENDTDSVLVPTFNSMKVPEPETGDSLRVTYRARHPKLSVTSATDLDAVTVDIPPVLLEPLLLYVASRMVAGVGEDGLQRSQAYLAQYEALCQQIKMDGTLQQKEYANTRLQDNKWP